MRKKYQPRRYRITKRNGFKVGQKPHNLQKHQKTAAPGASWAQMKKKKRKAVAASGNAGSAHELQSQPAAGPLTQPPPTENSSSLHLEEHGVKNASDGGGTSDTDPHQLLLQEQQQNEPSDAVDGACNVTPGVHCTPQEAIKILERFFTVLLMANTPAHLALKPFCGQQLTLDKIEEVLQQAGLPSDLVPTELKAFRSLGATAGCSRTAIDGQLLFDQASAIAFRVEMCELQVRAAVLEYATGAKTAKAKVDFQRIVAKLTSRLPSSSASDHQISSTDFERLLEEKLGLTPGGFLVKIMFARITGRRFQRSFPKVLETSKAAFCEAFERFCINKPLSGDSVEGQLRQLVIMFPDMRTAFQQMDLDGSGTISMAEFVAFLQREGNMCFPETVLTAFMKRFDFDGDGTLNYDEFIEFVRPKHFGVNVLSPFGMFHLAVNRLEKMGDVVQKIKTRLFWLQHNDLFAVASAASSTSAVGSASAQCNKAGAAQIPTAKLKVTDQFTLTHHFGSRRLMFEPKDPIVNVLANGELVVLILAKDADQQQQRSNTTHTRSVYAEKDALPPLPPFEYRLKPTTKRDLLPLFSTSEMMRHEQATVANKQKAPASTSSQLSRRAPTRTTIRKLSAAQRKPTLAASLSNTSTVLGRDEGVRSDTEIVRKQRPLEEEAPREDAMSRGTRSAVSLLSNNAEFNHTEELWQPPQQQSVHTNLPTESMPQLTMPAVEPEPPSLESRTSPKSQDSNSDAFELFEDDDGDEALPVSSCDLDACTALVVPEVARHQVEVDDDDDSDESPPPPYE